MHVCMRAQRRRRRHDVRPESCHRNPKIPKTAILLFVQIVHSYGTHNAIVVLVPASIETQLPEFANAGLLTPF
jgi:hypothetical protein